MQKSLFEIRASLLNQKETLSIFTYLLIAQDLLNEAIAKLKLDDTKLETLSLKSIKVNYANTLTEYISIEIDEKKANHKDKIVISAQDYVHQIFSILDKLLRSTNRRSDDNHDQRTAEFIKAHFDLYFAGKNNNPLEALENLSTLIRVINDDCKNTPFQIEEAHEENIAQCNTEEAKNPNVMPDLVEHEEIFSPRISPTNLREIFSHRGQRIVPLEISSLISDTEATGSIKEKPKKKSYSSYFFGTPKNSEQRRSKVTPIVAAST